MKVKNSIMLVALSGVILWSASGQSLPDYKFHTFSPEGGFYYDGVKSIQQDNSGFIWILMDYDLYRFDGYQHVSYYTYFQNMDPTTIRKFNYIATDTLGRLYVVANNKLFVHHANSNRFECLLDSTISYLKIDSKNRIWLKLPDLYQYIPESGKLVRMMYNNKPVSNISTFWDDNGQLYAVSTWGTIYKVDPENGIFTLHDERLPYDNYYNCIVWKNKTMWACDNRKRLYRVDGGTYKVIEVYNFLDVHENHINSLYIDNLGYVWIGTRRGLYILNPQTTEYSLFQNNRDDPFSISDNSVWTVNEDRQQNIWLGTYSGSLHYVNPNEKKQFKSNTPVNHRVISGFAEIGKELWIATEGGGISVVDKKTGNVSYKAYHPDGNSLAFNNVKKMVMDSIRKNIWISMFQGGLDGYNILAKKFTNYKNDSQNVNSLRFNNLRTIALEPDSGLWIAYQTSNLLLSFFSFDKKTFEHFSMDFFPDNNYYIFDICRDAGTDDLWFVTHQKLYRMNVKNKNIEEIPSSETINGQTLCVDAEQNVWVGTMGKGLLKYSVKDSSYSKYDDILKFKVSTIYSICPDHYGSLWLGTDNGLFRFDLTTDVFMQFTKSDGVHGRVFYPLASMQSSSGELYFGGTSGYTVITDPDIRINTYKPKAMISDILIDNVSILFDTTLHVHSAKTLKITHNQSNIGFLFSSDNYLMPTKNRFKYRLRGYDDRWVETDASNRYAFYTKLPAGNYTLELIASNNDGLWGDTPLQMNIRRLPAPWLSVWAYMLYTLIIFLTLFVVFRYYYRQKQLKMALYKESLEKQQREEIHQSQLSFFTNISHELKTPLSLILAVTDTLRKDGIREFYFKILNNNAQRLLHLVNELMLFRTVESGKQSLNLRMIDINTFVANIAEDFTDFSQQHDFRYSIHLDENMPKNIPADRMILEKIVTNLLNNAFRYTPDGGSISISTYYDRQYSPTYCNSYHTGNGNVENPFYIVVSDTGIGISEASISKIFERFYKVDTSLNQHLGSGMGLALVKSLVTLHKGSISVYSERDKGSEMVVALSKNATNYNEHDFDKSNLSDDIMPQHEEHVLMKEENNGENELYLRENKRILVVDDNEEMRKLIVGFLSQYYDMVEASDGVMASNLVRDMEIDLIISDIMIPLKDGVTLCSEIKNDINSSHIPFIILTAKTGQDSKLEGVESGADVYLEKPINFDILFQIIHNIFKRQERLKTHYAKQYFTDSGETSANRQNNAFLKKIYDMLDTCIDDPNLDVNYIASELMMSKTKLYTKLKSITGKSLVEMVRSYRLRKAAQMMIEENLSIGEVIMLVGIESQSYFTKAFKKEFGETPTAFVAKNKK